MWLLHYNVTAKSFLYDQRQGLSNNSITSIAKDKQGRLWVGTQKGLNTFDGYTFKVFPGLENHLIYQVLYDSVAFRIWIATSNGLYLINENTGNLVNCTQRVKHADVKFLRWYKSELYAVFTDGRILAISPQFKCRFVQYALSPKQRQSLHILKAVFDGNGFVYFVIKDAVNVVSVHLETGKKAELSFLKNNSIWNAFSGEGYCIVNTGGQSISLVNNRSTDFKSIGYKFPTNKVGKDLTTIYQNGDLFYIGFNDICDIYRLDTAGHRLVLVEDRKDEFLFRSRSLDVLFPDGSKVLWIGTNKGLIKQVSLRQQPFRKLLNEHERRLSVRQISKIDSTRIMIASYEGMFWYDTQLKTTQMLTNMCLRSFSYIDSYIYGGLEASKAFFVRYDTQSGSIDKQFFRSDGSTSGIRSILGMYHEKNKRLWMATDKGLATYDFVTNELVLHHSDSLSAGLEGLKGIYPNQDSTQLIAVGKKGVFILDLKRLKISEVNAKNTEGFPEDEYLFCTIHPNGDYWFGTNNSGIVQLSKTLKHAKAFNRKDGLSNNEVYSVLWKDSGHAWITTASGLNYFDLERSVFSTYYFEDGIADDEFNQNSYLLDGSEIYAGGINGVTVFNSKDIISKNDPFNIFCTSIEKWSSKTKIQLPDSVQIITMDPDYYLLKIVFGLGDFSTTESNSFYYQIKGVNKDWNPLGNTNILNLEGLSPGSYEVSIVGFNKFGNRSQNMLNLTIEVLQVYYKTLWFYTLLIVVVVGLIMLYYRWRLNNIRQRYQLRTNIASNLHDEVGSLLTSIIVSTDSARLASFSADEKDVKLKRISDLSRDAINTMSDVLWSIDARNDKAGSFTDRMREHASAMFDETPIEVQFDISQTDQNQFIEPDTRQQLYLIYKEALNNVLKHSNASYVRIAYKQRGKSFELKIENNNKIKSINANGQGLLNMSMRAKRIGASLSVKDNLNDLFTVQVIRAN
jgi:ligand-binding sensor domain-containing protein